MSVLKKIQGKFESVQQDLSAGIKSLRKGKANKASTTRNVQPCVTYHAGSDILHQYQESWFAMHTEMESSAQQSQAAADVIAATFSFVEKEHNLLTKLHEEMVTLPDLQESIAGIVRVIGKISVLGEAVEVSLVQLENYIEKVDREKDRRLHLNQLEVYRLKRQGDIERFRVQLASEHTAKVRDAETKRQAELSERHLYFQEAFNQDLEFYRIFGQIEKRLSPPHTVDLAEIVLDSDTTELDTFLENAEDDGSVTNSDIKTQRESGSEGEDSGIHNIHDSPTISPQVCSPEQSDETHHARASVVAESDNDNYDTNLKRPEVPDLSDESGAMNTDSQSEAMKTDSQSDAMNTDSQSDAMNTDSQSDAMNTDSQSEAMKTNSQSDAMNTDSQSDTMKTDSQSDAIKTDSQSDATNTNTQSAATGIDNQSNAPIIDSQSDAPNTDS